MEGVNTIYFDRSKGAVVMNVKQVVDNSENYNQSVAFAVAYDWSTEIIRLRVEENQVAYYNDTCGYVTTSADLDDGDWHQVAITWNWNENRRRIYIDGEMKKEGTYTEHYYTIPTDYRIGDFHSTYYFRGYMDELRVYDRELYPFELEELVPPRRAVSPPDNDECEDAEVLTSGQTKTGALTASATPSNENECNPEVPDVWYKFTVPLEYDEPCVIVNYSDWGDASFEGFASIYSGTCEELTQEVCDTTRNSSHPYEFHLEYLSQNPGETIYICVGSERETINQQLQLTCFDKMEEK